MTNNIGNISTILKTISLIFAGYAIAYFAGKGFALPINEEQLAEIIFSLLGLLLAYIDAKNPNTFAFLDNDNVLVDLVEEDLIF